MAGDVRGRRPSPHTQPIGQHLTIGLREAARHRAGDLRRPIHRQIQHRAIGQPHRQPKHQTIAKT
ncbi:Uncharacterised protein [Mycobacteroides abscessus subsp. abscessus]|nr:Uncharacterised protein [Mycobacteroides abscessus subsp. abscessus]